MLNDLAVQYADSEGRQYTTSASSPTNKYVFKGLTPLITSTITLNWSLCFSIYVEDVADGLESAPDALIGLFRGKKL